MVTRRTSTTVFAVILMVAFASCARRPATDAPLGRAQQPAGSRIVTVAFVQGAATVNGSAVEIGDTLPTRLAVVTGIGARLDIIFDGLNALSIGQNAFVDVDLSLVAPQLRLERGGVTAVLKKLEKIAATDSFTVQTAESVMGVRGTSFCVWADAASTYVCACNGEIHTIDAKGNHEETLASAHHLGRIYAPAGSGISVVAAGMIHHDDQSVQSVASRIGYTIDWTRIDK